MFFSSCTGSTKSRFQPEKYFTGNLLPLGQAIYDDDTKAVKRLITQKDISVDTADIKYGYCLLLYAINAESKSVVKTLLELGANPNQLSITKVYERNNPNPVRTPHRYPLTNAINKEDLFYTKILLQYGADPNLGNPLHAAITNAPEKSVFKMFDLLLEHGSNINALDRNGKTPVFLSAFIQRTDYVNYFIDHGANIHIPDNRNETVAWQIQEIIDKNKNISKEGREKFMERIQPTINRLEARGVKFPVEKPKAPKPADETAPVDENEDKPKEQAQHLQQPGKEKTWTMFFDEDEDVL